MRSKGELHGDDEHVDGRGPARDRPDNRAARTGPRDANAHPGHRFNPGNAIHDGAVLNQASTFKPASIASVVLIVLGIDVNGVNRASRGGGEQTLADV